jgi:signal peptidase I
MAKRADRRRREIDGFRASNEPEQGTALDSPTNPTVKRPRSLAASLVELAVIVVIALGFALGIERWLVKPYRIPSGSMEPTLRIGQRVLAKRLYFGGPHVGQITVFHPPEGAGEEQCGPTPHFVKPGGAPCDETYPHPDNGIQYIKRIVAGPGDEIYIKEGHAYLREPGKSTFVREHDPYIKSCGARLTCNFTTPIKIPPGHWFMMGDNRGGSDDSRFWGPVPRSWIIGQAFFTYWPLNRIGSL